MKHTVEQQENLTLRQSMIEVSLVEDGKLSVFAQLLIRNFQLKQLLSQQEQPFVAKLS